MSPPLCPLTFCAEAVVEVDSDNAVRSGRGGLNQTGRESLQAYAGSPPDCAQSGLQRNPPCARACSLRGRDGECELDRIADDIGLTAVARNQAKPICCAIMERRLARGKEIGVVAASSIYAACREDSLPITLKELARASHSTPRELGKFYRLILNKMEMKPPNPNRMAYIAKLVAKIHASDEVARLSLEIESKAVKGEVGGMSPMSLAAASLYRASLAKGEPLTQADVAEAAGVGVISLREAIKKMRFLAVSRE